MGWLFCCLFIWSAVIHIEHKALAGSFYRFRTEYANDNYAIVSKIFLFFLALDFSDYFRVNQQFPISKYFLLLFSFLSQSLLLRRESIFENGLCVFCSSKQIAFKYAWFQYIIWFMVQNHHIINPWEFFWCNSFRIYISGRANWRNRVQKQRLKMKAFIFSGALQSTFEESEVSNIWIDHAQCRPPAIGRNNLYFFGFIFIKPHSNSYPFTKQCRFDFICLVSIYEYVCVYSRSLCTLYKIRGSQ